MASSAKVVPSKLRRKPAQVEPKNGSGELAASTLHNLKDPELYINRELSLLDFQRRVLEEAQDASNPLLDRLMFLSFVGSNIDEFFMVRVAGLKRQIEKGVVETGPDGLTPTEQLRAIRASVIRLYRASYDTWRRELVSALAESGIRILWLLGTERRAACHSQRHHFQDTIFPTLTPLAFDPGRPFPHISNLSLNLAVVLRDQKGIEHFARVKIPDNITGVACRLARRLRR